VKYVSNDTSYGLDYSLWPENFARYVEAYLAWRIIKRLSQNKSDLDDLEKLVNFRIGEAKNTDALEGPTVFPPSGSWVRSRSGGSSRERGGRNQLIG